MIKFFFIDWPNLFEAVSEMVSELFIYISAPRILAVVRKRAKKLLQNVLKVVYFFCVFELTTGN